ncbi:hypothetical protein KAI19_03650 [bacterium]|nr:hypothetical protein [bacterium]
MEEKINLFEDLDFLSKDVLIGVGGKTSHPWLYPKIENYKGISDYSVKNNNYLYDHKDILNTNSSIRVLGTRHLNPLTQPGIARIKNVRSYKPKKETKLLKTGKACPYWKENGWKKIDRTYCGYYKTRYGNWEGLVKENFFNNHSFFIFSPPDEVLTGSHSACFTHKGNGAYAIHFAEKPGNISEGIIAVEMLIAKSMN